MEPGYIGYHPIDEPEGLPDSEDVVSIRKAAVRIGYPHGQISRLTRGVHDIWVLVNPPVVFRAWTEDADLLLPLDASLGRI